MARCAAAQHLRQGERSDRLHQRGRAGRERQRHQQIRAPLSGNVVDEVLEEAGSTRPARRLTSISASPSAMPPAARPDEGARLAPDHRRIELFLGFLVAVRGGGRRRIASPPARPSDRGSPSPPLSPVAMS